MRFAASLLLVAPLLVTSCGGGGSSDPKDLVNDGYQALGGSDFSAAQEAFEGALAAIGDDPGNSLYLEAKKGLIEAKTKADPDGALADVKALHAAQPDQVSDEDFSRIASKLGGNKHFDQAIALLDFADDIYKDSAILKSQGEALVEAAESAGNSAAAEALRGLGYVGD